MRYERRHGQKNEELSPRHLSGAAVHHACCRAGIDCRPPRPIKQRPNYDDAIVLLSRLDRRAAIPRIAGDQSISRVCLLALGRAVEAERAFEAVCRPIVVSPGRERRSPRLRTLRQRQQRNLPATSASQEYAGQRPRSIGRNLNSRGRVRSRSTPSLAITYLAPRHAVLPGRSPHPGHGFRISALGQCNIRGPACPEPFGGFGGGAAAARRGSDATNRFTKARRYGRVERRLIRQVLPAFQR